MTLAWLDSTLLGTGAMIDCSAMACASYPDRARAEPCPGLFWYYLGITLFWMTSSHWLDGITYCLDGIITLFWMKSSHCAAPTTLWLLDWLFVVGPAALLCFFAALLRRLTPGKTQPLPWCFHCLRG